MRILAFYSLFFSVTVSAQTLMHTKIVISTDQTNVFPLFSSTAKPRVAATVNKTLQILSFNHINVEKSPSDYEDSERYSTWNFAVDYSNDRLLHVTTIHNFPKQSMHTDAFSENLDFWFDLATGDQIDPYQFVALEKLQSFKMRAITLLSQEMTKRHAELAKKYSPSKYGKAFPDLQENLASLNKKIDWIGPNDYDVAAKGFRFAVNWTVEEYSEDLESDLDRAVYVLMGPNEIEPFASGVWKYYVTRTTPVRPTPDPINHTWSGMIGGKIPVTFVITSKPGSAEISGYEVYDKFGGVIKLKGSLKNGLYYLDELDDNGVKAGSFEFTSNQGNLMGSWKNGNGTKTMDFKAAIGASSLP